AFLVISFVSIPEPHLQKSGAKKEQFSHSPWSFRHTLLGVIGIFIYVGVEIGIPGTLNFYLSDASEKGAGILTNGAAIGGAIAAIYWLLMLVGRSVSSAISGKVSSRTQLIVVSAAAIVFVLSAIFTPKIVTVSMPGYSVTEGFNMSQVPLSALFLVLCGLCTSVMWGGIFNLAVEGLGKYTAQASGIFMMMVVGGGVLPVLQQFISDSFGYMASYWLIIAALAYLLFYGLVGCKNVNKDIPVE
ncbi:MAG TPA: MFS transporter, partial [Paludibacter sp.]|nr:MFS transporter [Paludibacter sp.]